MTARRKTLHQVANLHVTTSRFGFRGIVEHNGKFRARIHRGSGQSRAQSLGYFETAEQAALAYDRAARKEYGRLAALNFPLDGERRVVPSPVSDVLCSHGHDLHVFGYLAPDGRLYCRKCNTEAQIRYRKKRASSAHKRGPT
jgi:hypothetical protein